MPAVNGFQLTDSDLEIFVSVFEHRFVTIDHLILLTNRPHKRLHRRILKLIERGYLSRIILPTKKHIYTLGRAAIPTLVERGIAPKEFIDVRLRHQELKDLFLKHAVMIVNVHSALTVATRTSHIKLVVWKEGQELFDRVVVRDQGRPLQLPVRPDGFFTLEDTTRPLYDGGRSLNDNARAFSEKSKSLLALLSARTPYEEVRHKHLSRRHVYAYGGARKKPMRSSEICLALTSAKVLPVYLMYSILIAQSRLNTSGDFHYTSRARRPPLSLGPAIDGTGLYKRLGELL